MQLFTLRVHHKYNDTIPTFYDLLKISLQPLKAHIYNCGTRVVFY